MNRLANSHVNHFAVKSKANRHLKPRKTAKANHIPLLACFFFSGMSGLIYQVAWIKALGLIFGHTLFAIATVLSVFMAGLATGSAYIGRWRSDAKPVVLYAYIELLVAASGFLSLVGLRSVGWLYVKFYPDVAGLSALLLALRFFGAVAVLFVPTFLMGGTLPILARVVAKNSDELGAGVSQLYWINTLGAVVGTVISGFILLPVLGLRGTIATAVALNVLAGLVALKIPKKLSPQQDLENSKNNPEKDSEKNGEAVTPSRLVGPQPTLTLLLFFFAVVGCTAFVYEIAWTRLLSITVSSSTYAFTTMLAMFLTGIVLGSASFRYFVARSGNNLAGHFLQNAKRGSAPQPFYLWSRSTGSCLSFPSVLRATNRTFGGLFVSTICHQWTNRFTGRHDFWLRFSNGDCTLRRHSKLERHKFSDRRPRVRRKHRRLNFWIAGCRFLAGSISRQFSCDRSGRWSELFVGRRDFDASHTFR